LTIPKPARRGLCEHASSFNDGGIMAIDVYLQIDGIKGESQDSAHQGWIELTSAHWGVLQPRSATASTAGGHSVACAFRR
jgi:hypothetical protein